MIMNSGSCCLSLGKNFHKCWSLFMVMHVAEFPKSNPACQSRQMTGGVEEYAERFGRILQEGW